jgi:uncharacterized protein (TIGR03435 family)
MKRREKNVEEFMLRHLGLFKTPPQSEMDLVETRIVNRLRSAPAADGAAEELDSRGNSWKLRRLAFVLGAAAAAVIAVVFLQTPRGIDTHAVVESADGTLSRVSGAKTESVRSGGRIDAGEILRANDGGAIALADGSRVELRSQSEFSVERGDDGVRIHLRKGSLIVKAAKQVAGRLYVHTKDMVVSVVGTVFLVSAAEEGSHVSVIEGEVRVQHGETTKNLLPGEQFTTNPKRQVPPVKEEISWSREAEVHVALLEESAAAPPPQQNPVEARVAFDVVSIRPGNPYQMPPAGARGVPPGDGAKPATPPPAGVPDLARTLTCGGRGSELDVNPGRMTLQNGTVYRLIVLGYGLKDCILSLQMGLISGGPEWVRTDRFDIAGTIPEGSPVYTWAQLNNGEATRLQLMIQTLLAERFNLVLERETKDLPAYNLVVARAGRIKASEDQTPPPALTRGVPLRANALPRGVMLNCAGNGLLISAVAGCLQKNLSGTIIDKTDLKGLYDIPLAAPDPSFPGISPEQMLEPLGLKLELTKRPGEVYAIRRVERPTEN